MKSLYLILLIISLAISFYDPSNEQKLLRTIDVLIIFTVAILAYTLGEYITGTIWLLFWMYKHFNNE